MKHIQVVLHQNNRSDEVKYNVKDGEILTIQNVRGVNYELLNTKTGFAPQNIIAKRVGQDLVIILDENEGEGSHLQMNPDIVIKDYYGDIEEEKAAGLDQQEGEVTDATGILIGLHENGKFYAYVPESASVEDAVTILHDGDMEPQAIGGEEIGATVVISPWWGLLGLLPLAFIPLAFIGKGGGGSTPTPEPTPDITVDAPDNTNDTTPTITGTTNLPNGSTITVVITDKEGSKQTITTTAKDGKYTVTPDTPLAEGEYKVTAEGKSPTGKTVTDDDKGNINFAPIAQDDKVDVTEDQVVKGNVIKGQVGTEIKSEFADSDKDTPQDQLKVTQFEIDANHDGHTQVFQAGETAEITKQITNENELKETIKIGKLTINADGSYVFEPAPNYFDEDESVVYKAKYTLVDGTGTKPDTADLILSHIKPASDTPAPLNDEKTIKEDTVTVIDVLENDKDVDGDPLTITKVDGQNIVEGQTVILKDGVSKVKLENGKLEFTPKENSTETVDFTYTVTDGQTEVPANVKVLIDPVNDKPVATDDPAETNEDTPVTVDVIKNDSDVETPRDELTIKTVDGKPIDKDTPVTLDDGSKVELVDGKLKVTPPANKTDDITFDYTIVDKDGAESDPATVTVDVKPVNDKPVANDDLRDTPEDTPITIDVTKNDTDVETPKDKLVVNKVDGNPIDENTPVILHDGTKVELKDGKLKVTPPENKTDTIEFDYTVLDEEGKESDPATVTVNVTPANDQPDANDDPVSTPEETPVPIDVLDNDNDPDDDILTITKVEGQPITEGTPITLGDGSTVELVTKDGKPQLKYTPAENVTGKQDFTYTISDGKGGEDTAKVTVDVGGVNDTPVAQPNKNSTNEDTVLTVAKDDVENVLKNDTDDDHDPLTVASVSKDGIAGTVGQALEGTYGTLTLNKDGSYTYEPNAEAQKLKEGQEVNDVFKYTAKDPSQAETQAVDLTIKITGTNDAPVAVIDDRSKDTLLEDGTPLTGNVLNNDSDVDTPHNELIVTKFEIDTNGDGTATEFTAGKTATLTKADGTKIGELTIKANGEYSFTPAPDYNGDVPKAHYTMSDNDAKTPKTASADLVLPKVTPVNDVPEAVADTGETKEDVTLTVDKANGVLHNDTDKDDGNSDGLVVASVSKEDGTAGTVGQALEGKYGSLTLNEDGSYTYVPNDKADKLKAGEKVDDVFKYIAKDSDNATSNETTLTIKITGTNDGPVAEPDSKQTIFNQPITIDVLGNDTDIDTPHDQLTVTQINGQDITAGTPVTITDKTGKTIGTATLNDDKTITFNPADGYEGAAKFKYTVSDGTDTDEGDVTVTVGENKAPVVQPENIPATEDKVVNFDLRSNAVDPDGSKDDLVITKINGQPIHKGDTVDLHKDGKIVGKLTMKENGQFSFEPTKDFNGEIPFEKTVADKFGKESSANSKIIVAPMPDVTEVLPTDGKEEGEKPVEFTVNFDSPSTVDAGTKVLLNLKPTATDGVTLGEDTKTPIQVSSDGGQTWDTVTLDKDGNFTATLKKGSQQLKVKLPVQEDPIVEGNESITLGAGIEGQTPVTGTAKIIDNDKMQVKPNNPDNPNDPNNGVIGNKVEEGTALEFTVTLDKTSTSPTIVNVTPKDGTGTVADDLVIGSQVDVVIDGTTTKATVKADGTIDVEVPAGKDRFIVKLPTKQNDVYEGDETIKLDAKVVGQTTPSEGTGTITDNDDKPEVKPNNPDNPNDPNNGVIGNKVEEGTALEFTVTLDKTSTSPTIVNVTPKDGTGTVADDLVIGSQVDVVIDGTTTKATVKADGTIDVEVPAGKDRFIVKLPTKQNDVYEGDETIKLDAKVVGQTTPSEGTGTITDNDDKPEVKPNNPDNPNDPNNGVIPHNGAEEGEQAVTFDVNFTNTSTTETAVTLHLESASTNGATLGTDTENKIKVTLEDGTVVKENIQVDSSGNFTVNLPAGSKKLIVSVPVEDDDVVEKSEGVTLSAKVTGQTTPTEATGLIIDNDKPTISIARESAAVAHEGTDEHIRFVITQSDAIDENSQVMAKIDTSVANSAEWKDIFESGKVTVKFYDFYNGSPVATMQEHTLGEQEVKNLFNGTGVAVRIKAGTGAAGGQKPYFDIFVHDDTELEVRETLKMTISSPSANVEIDAAHNSAIGYIDSDDVPTIDINSINGTAQLAGSEPSDTNSYGHINDASTEISGVTSAKNGSSVSIEAIDHHGHKVAKTTTANNGAWNTVFTPQELAGLHFDGNNNHLKFKATVTETVPNSTVTKTATDIDLSTVDKAYIKVNGTNNFRNNSGAREGASGDDAYLQYEVYLTDSTNGTAVKSVAENVTLQLSMISRGTFSDDNDFNTNGMQYSTDGTHWKNVPTNKQITIDAGNTGKIKVRVPIVDDQQVDRPSHSQGLENAHLKATVVSGKGSDILLNNHSEGNVDFADNDGNVAISVQRIGNANGMAANTIKEGDTSQSLRFDFTLSRELPDSSRVMVKVDQSVANSVRQDDLTDAKFHYVDDQGNEQTISFNTSKLFGSGEGFNIPANTDVSKKAYFEFKAANNSANDVQTETLQLKIISTSDNLTVTTATAKGYIEEGNQRPTADNVDHELTIGDSIYYTDELQGIYVAHLDRATGETEREFLSNPVDPGDIIGGLNKDPEHGFSDLVIDKFTNKVYTTKAKNLQNTSGLGIINVTEIFEVDMVTNTKHKIGQFGGFGGTTGRQHDKHQVSGLSVIDGKFYVSEVNTDARGVGHPKVSQVHINNAGKVVVDQSYALPNSPSGDMATMGDTLYISLNHQKEGTAPKDQPDYLVKLDTKTGFMTTIGDLWTMENGQRVALTDVEGLSAVNGRLYASNAKPVKGKAMRENIIYEVDTTTGEAKPVFTDFHPGVFIRDDMDNITGGSGGAGSSWGQGGSIADMLGGPDALKVHNVITGMGSGLEGKFDTWKFSLENKVSDPENNNTVKIQFTELPSKGKLYVKSSGDGHNNGDHYDEVNTSTQYAKNSEFKFVADKGTSMHNGDSTKLKYVAVDEQGQRSDEATIRVYDKVVEHKMVETSVAHIDANNVNSNQGFTVTATKTVNGRTTSSQVSHSARGIGVNGNPYGDELGSYKGWGKTEVEKLDIQFTGKKAQSVDIAFNGKANGENVLVEFYDGNTKVGSTNHNGQSDSNIAIRFMPDNGAEFNKIVITPEGNNTRFYIKDINAHRLEEDLSSRSTFSADVDDQDVDDSLSDQDSRSVTEDSDNQIVYDDQMTEMDAGLGFDTLMMDSQKTINLNLDRVVSKVKNIEAINMKDGGSDTDELTMSAQDVLDLTDSHHVLTIMGDASDKVILDQTKGVWQAGDDVVQNGQTYHAYTVENASLDKATLLIEEHIAVII
ncbi:MAG: Ig-like domain-containing protein [Alcaligenaceae bacterium]|nr:Ig-like domain-containing protein [Alcaligenaceae bacterium]